MKWLIDGDAPGVLDQLGLIPTLLNENDERSAAEQFGANYGYGGWRPMPGFVLRQDGSLQFPGDPPLHSLAYSRLRDELIMIYPHAWVAVIQRDGSFEVARLD